MKLKDLPEYINSHLKEHSLAFARLKEGFLDDEVIVEHPDPKDFELGSTITIIKSFGWWYLEYEKWKDDDVSIRLEIKSSDDREDVRDIVEFVNSHTMHDTPKKEGEETEGNEEEEEEKKEEEETEENKEE